MTDATLGPNPVYYKATVPERGQDATVTVKHEGNETVVLKSRTGPKSRIYIVIVVVPHVTESAFEV